MHDLENALAAAGEADPGAVAALRWQLEELRVSLFAQQLGTPTPISVQRIRKQLATLT